MPSYVRPRRLKELRFADDPKVTVEALRRWANAGRLPGARNDIGGGWLVDLEELDGSSAPPGVRSLSEIIAAAGYRKGKRFEE